MWISGICFHSISLTSWQTSQGRRSCHLNATAKCIIQITQNYPLLQENWLLEYSVHISNANLQWGHTLISHLRGYPLLPYSTCPSPNPTILASHQVLWRLAIMANWQQPLTYQLLLFLHLSQYNRHFSITNFHRILRFKANFYSHLQLEIKLELVFSLLCLLSQFEQSFHPFSHLSFDCLGQRYIWIPQWNLGATVL